MSKSIEQLEKEINSPSAIAGTAKGQSDSGMSARRSLTASTLDRVDLCDAGAYCS